MKRLVFKGFAINIIDGEIKKAGLNHLNSACY